ncbi:MAG: type II toxin-antitoxin system VapC family toxin [Rhodospirillaceae bacterium]|nr:type II toxin-antitoxin system VapC family toxin [Rhodospirillaceae bacterium]
MNITADTNVLVRALTEDDPRHGKIAQQILGRADLVAVPTTTLCEFVWVLGQGYKLDTASIAGAVRGLIGSANVALSRPAAEAGLALLDAGGDFADGVIAFEGAKLGGETFVSFDKKAVKLLDQRGHAARLLA